MPVVLLYVAALAILGPALRMSQWYVSPENNQGAAEATAWLDGRLHLDSRGGDTAKFEGRPYNIFPPLWTSVCFAYYGLTRLAVGEPLAFFTVIYVALVAAPVPLLIYLAFRRSGAGRSWAAVLALYALAGTCLWTEATRCRTGWIYAIQHVVSQTGLAILLIDLLGRRRWWLAGVGVWIAAWCRFFCIVYSLPVLWLAWRSERRMAAVLKAGLPIALAVGGQMTLNHLKFGSPLETGYSYLYVDAPSPEADAALGPDGRHHAFAWKHVPGHAWHMFVQPPWFYLKFDGLEVTGSGGGTGIWYGTPILLLVLFDIRRWWSDPARRALMLATLPIIGGVLAFVGPGYGTPGYYRYTLDFSLVWMAVIAPWTFGPRRKWWTLACLAWSGFYFYMVTPTMGF